jgi:hypothetical protein
MTSVSQSRNFRREGAAEICHVPPRLVISSPISSPRRNAAFDGLRQQVG